jgi:apolipoprotein N-acyltransferase
MRAEGPVTAFVCTLLTAAGFYFSIRLGEQWWLAWLAPIPVLCLAFSDTKGWQVFLAAWAAYALGATSILKAYGGILPLPGAGPFPGRAVVTLRRGIRRKTP